jgi:HEAT repeat protein
VGHDHDTVANPGSSAEREAILAAAWDPSEAATRGLVGALGSPDPALRVSALGALARSQRLEASHVLELLDDETPRVRRRAAELAPKARGRRSRAELGRRLAAALADPDRLVVIAALGSLGARGDDAALGAVLDLARSSDDALVVEAAVACLAELGDPAGLEVILSASRGGPALRRRCVAALGAFEGPEVEAALDRLAEDRDWQVRQAVAMLRRPGAG